MCDVQRLNPLTKPNYKDNEREGDFRIAVVAIWQYIIN